MKKMSRARMWAHIVAMVMYMIFTLLGVAGLACVVADISWLGLLKAAIGGVCIIVIISGFYCTVYLINMLRGKIDVEEGEE